MNFTEYALKNKALVYFFVFVYNYKINRGK